MSIIDDIEVIKDELNQLKSKIAKNFNLMVPVGTVIAFAGENPPSNYLTCDGALKKIEDYPDLYAAIGEAWGARVGEEFRLPNLQGQFLRGVSGESDADPDVNNRQAFVYRDKAGNHVVGGNDKNQVGSYQSDAIQDHRHIFWFNRNVGGGGPGRTGKDAYDLEDHVKEVDPKSARVSSETRPKNAYVYFVIRAH